MIMKLGDVCTFDRGLTYSKADEVANSSNGVLRSNNIDLVSNTLCLDEIKYIREDIDIPESKKTKKGSILICMANGSKCHLGKVAIIDIEEVFAFGGFMGLITPTETISSKYLYYSLITPKYKKLIASLSDGANINNLKFRDIQDFEIPVPPLSEQTRIVEKLDAAFEKIDRLKENAEKGLQAVKDLWQATLREELKPKEGWASKTMNDVCAITSSLVDPKLPEYKDMLHIGGSNIESYTGKLYNLLTAEQENLVSNKFKFDQSMVLYNKIRPYLVKIAMPDFDGLCSADMYPLKPKDGIITREYLYYVLNSKEFTDYAILGSARAGMPKVNRDWLFAYSFSIPNIEKQKQIVSKLVQTESICNVLQIRINQEIAEYEALKQSILRKAFSGEL